MIARFQNLPIIAKIAVPATIVALVAVGIVVQASMALSDLSATAASLVDGNAMRVQYSLQAESYFNSAAVSEKNVILSGSDSKAISSNIEILWQGDRRHAECDRPSGGRHHGSRTAPVDRHHADRRQGSPGSQRQGVRTDQRGQDGGSLCLFAQCRRQAPPDRHRGGREIDRHQCGRDARRARPERRHRRVHPPAAGDRGHYRPAAGVRDPRLDRVWPDRPAIVANDA